MKEVLCSNELPRNHHALGNLLDLAISQIVGSGNGDEGIKCKLDATFQIQATQLRLNIQNRAVDLREHSFKGVSDTVCSEKPDAIDAMVAAESRSAKWSKVQKSAIHNET